MSKPKLLYASPMPPLKSGISDYSVMLLKGLCRYYDVTLAIDDYELSDINLCPDIRVVRFKKDTIDWDKYDFKLYNMGNQPWFHGHIYEACLDHPGTVILHDFVLYFLVVGWYMNRPNFYNKIYEIAGVDGLRMIQAMRLENRNLLEFENPQLLPLTGELLHSGNSILCHSRYTLSQCAMVAPNARLGHIKMAWANNARIGPDSRARLLAKWQIPNDAVVVGSFGYVAPTKLNHVVCEAIRRHNESASRKIYYVMVGDGDYVRDRMDGFMRITGFVDTQEFAEWMGAVDVVVNLRFPSKGETSLATVHALAEGKPCVVTNYAWFSELEDEIVLKVPFPNGEGAISGLQEALRSFTESPEVFIQMGASGKAMIEKEYSVESVCRSIEAFLNGN